MSVSGDRKNKVMYLNRYSHQATEATNKMAQYIRRHNIQDGIIYKKNGKLVHIGVMF